jgi:transcriptional regulator with XRE-family HTH domain
MTKSANKRSADQSPDGTRRGVGHDGPHMEIGARLKHTRLAKELSLRSLSEAVGCSEGFLSKIENNKARPSLAMLHRLVTELSINIADLFSGDGLNAGPVCITRKGDRKTIKTDLGDGGNGVVLERLVPNTIAKLIEANIHVISARGASDGYIQHEGEEMGFVISGMIELNIAGATYVVEEGDTFFFKSSLQHSYKNIGSKQARILWVNTPPTF